MKFTFVSVIQFVITAAWLLPSGISAETEARGVIGRDERWTADKAPYVLTDDVLVAKNARLYIGPGVTVLARKPHSYDPRIPQLDNLDSFTVAVKVQGTITCAGRQDNRITFTGAGSDSAQCEWYGLVLDGILANESEIGFTDIAGSCNGCVVRAGSPTIHHCVFEYNNIGLTITDGSKARIINCAIARNLTAGVRVTKANPILYNNLIVYNRSYGVWSDGISHLTFENNCVFGNADLNLSGCDPELGAFMQVNDRKDSVDNKNNLYEDPIFTGTPAESLSMERDVKLPARKTQSRDTSVAKLVYGTLADSLPFIRPAATASIRYKPSPYSPCIDAGKKNKAYKDPDGTINDIGIHGGPEFFLSE